MEGGIVRLFSAIDFPPHVLQVLAGRQARLRAQVAAQRWQRTELSHLTVQFFGELEPEQLPALIAAIQEGVHPFSPFELRLGDLGFFPPRRRPRVLWCGLKGEVATLLKMEAFLWEACLPLGLKKEQRLYSPHITLAREVASPIDWDTLAWEDDELPATWLVAQIALYRSEFSAAGARYSRLAAFDFAGN